MKPAFLLAYANAIAVLLAVFSASAHAEALTYELYALDGEERKLLSQGTRQYGLGDVRVEEHRYREERFWSKEIPVARGFTIGISVYPTVEGGFGLWLKDRDSFMGKMSAGGLSWDWFTYEAGTVYRKLQGSGKVRVSFSTSSPGITSVEVVEDITLRASVRPWFMHFISEGDTHHMLVRKGSILRFAR